jgi:predicted Zn-dependent peptidase
LSFGKYIPLAEVIASIDRVTGEDILRLSCKVFGRQEFTLAGLGPFEKTGIDWKP